MIKISHLLSSIFKVKFSLLSIQNYFSITAEPNLLLLQLLWMFVLLQLLWMFVVTIIFMLLLREIAS